MHSIVGKMQTFYSVVLTAGSIHVNTLLSSPVPLPILLTFSIMMLIFSASTVVTSVVLIMGLCTDKKLLMLPWMVSLSLTTVLDIVLSLYLATDSVIDPFFGVLFAADFLICILNIYCLLCVSSQYQEYRAGRGRSGQMTVDGMLPAIHFEPASCGGAGGGVGETGHRSPKLTVNVVRNGRASPSAYLLPGSRHGSSSSGGQTCSSPLTHHLFSRSSISSTSEISFTSSGGSASSRRGSVLIRDRSDSLYARNTALAQLAAASSVLGQPERFGRRLSQMAFEENMFSNFPAEEDEEEEGEEGEDVDDDPTQFEIAEFDESDIFVPELQSAPRSTTSRFRQSSSLFQKNSGTSTAPRESFPSPSVSPSLKEVSTPVEEETEPDIPATS